MQDYRCSQHCSWGFQSSGTWCCTAGYMNQEGCKKRLWSRDKKGTSDQLLAGQKSWWANRNTCEEPLCRDGWGPDRAVQWRDTALHVSHYLFISHFFPHSADLNQRTLMLTEWSNLTSTSPLFNSLLSFFLVHLTLKDEGTALLLHGKNYSRSLAVSHLRTPKSSCTDSQSIRGLRQYNSTF